MTGDTRDPGRDDGIVIDREHLDAIEDTYTITRAGESILGFALRTRILTLDDELAEATRAYAAASATLAEATCREHEARGMHEAFVTRRRAEAHARGLPGTNEAARAAALADILRTDGDIALGAGHLEELCEARIMAEHHYRVADVAQKALRARLNALAALVTEA
jgi:hypothetical protein